MTTDQMKQAAARAALAYVPEGAIVGVGTGSTVNFFIDGLADLRAKIKGAVSRPTFCRTFLIGLKRAAAEQNIVVRAWGSRSSKLWLSFMAAKLQSTLKQDAAHVSHAISRNFVPLTTTPKPHDTAGLDVSSPIHTVDL